MNQSVLPALLEIEQVAALLENHPAILEEVIEYRNKSSLPADYNPSTIRVLCEDVVVALWEGKPVFELEVSPNYVPEILVIEMDEEPVFIKARGVLVLNRVNDPVQEVKNYVY